MVKTRHFDPDLETIVESQIDDVAEVAELMNAVLALSSERGHPAAELVRDDGASLVLVTDGRRAALSWTNSLGVTFHSTGDLAVPTLVFDYFGSWTEVPSDHQVRLADAVDCAMAFVRTGFPDTSSVMFSPD
jgi:Immunity protein Imm1